MMTYPMCCSAAPSSMSSLLFLLVAVLWFVTICNGGLACKESDKLALLSFKSRLIDPFYSLDSWNPDGDDDCCHWAGVHCSNNTGQVTGLDLSNKKLSGEISSDLLGLQNLRHLDLSGNIFHGKHIPKFLGSFKYLSYLDLSLCGFEGAVPHELGNLSTLLNLNLTQSYLDNCFVDSDRWLAGLSSLQYLDMSFINFSKVENWTNVLATLPFIRKIVLNSCSLTTIPKNLPNASFAFLTYLDLSHNEISSVIPKYLLPQSLEFVDLSSNQISLEDSILEALQKLCNLRVLRLNNNNLSIGISELTDIFSGCIGDNLEELDLHFTGLMGNLPNWIGHLRNLRKLDLSINSLHGPIPESLGELVNLETLSLSTNSFDGVLSEVHLSNLTNLKFMDISFVPSLGLEVNPHWKPPFQLRQIYMSSSKIGPRFPLWLCTQKKLSIFEMAMANISDVMPDCFWNSSTQLYWLDISQNEITGEVKPFAAEQIMLFEFDVSDNLLSGTIPDNFGDMMPNLQFLYFQENHVHGKIPSSLCNLKDITILDLAGNYLSGSIPDCWNNSNLQELYFSRNNLSGELPDSIFSSSIRLLHLQKNNLHGGIPVSLRNCKQLIEIDFSFNNLHGTIPEWLGDNLPSLTVLLLSSNNFFGTLPPQLSNLTSLRILDLSSNDLSGTIPKSFGKFKAMSVEHTFYDIPNPFYGTEGMSLGIKGNPQFYNYYVLWLMVIIDLSENRLSGTIPEELVNLQTLMSLNLSHNSLVGGINGISELVRLESLDLSSNLLSGEIPSSFSTLNFLSQLNLSYNNFSGKIPFGGQLQVLDDPSIYIGNDDLCGRPLPKSCQDDPGNIADGPTNEKIEQSEMLWFYSGIALGFVVGFWAICGSLLLKQSWKIAYFKFIDNMQNRIHVVVGSNLAQMK